MKIWQRLASRAKEASHLTAAAIALGFAVPVAINLHLQHDTLANIADDHAALRIEAVANVVAHALEQTISATTVLSDSFNQGNAEMLARTSSSILRILGATAHLEIKPEGSLGLLIANHSAPPSKLDFAVAGMSGTWKAPVPMGDPTISVRDQQLLVTQPMINRSLEGRTRFWGQVTISQPFSALARTAQLNLLSSENLSIRVRYLMPARNQQTLLFDSYAEGAATLASKTLPLPGDAQLQFEVARQSPLAVMTGDWLFLAIASLALYIVVLMALRHPALLQRRIRLTNQLLEDEKRALEKEIGERLEAEKMLERSHRLLDSIFEHIPGMIVIKRASDRRIVRINRSAEEIFARARHTLLGRSNEELYEPDLAERLDRSDDSVIKMRQPMELAVEQYRMPGQSARWIRVRKTVLPGENGTPEYILEFGRDVTEQEQLDRRLREHLHFLEQLIDAIPSPLFFKDTEGRYISFNHAFEKYIGISREKLTGKTVFDIAEPALAHMYHRADMELLASGGSQIYESAVRDAEGESRDVMFHKAVFHQTDGDKGGIVGIILDITERKQAEQQVARLNRLLTVISEVNDAIFRIHRADQLLTEVATLLCASGEFPLAWIQTSADGTPHLGDRADDAEKLVQRLLAKLPPLDSTASSGARRLPTGELADVGLVEELKRRQLLGITLLPLRTGTTAGLIGLLDNRPNGLSEQERQLLEDLANNVSQALERVAAETQKREAAEQLELAARVFENSAEGIMITDAQNRILLVNRAFSSVTGFAPEEVIGQNPNLLSSGRQDPGFYRAMWESLQSTGEWHGEIENRRKNGTIYPEWLNISVVRQPDGKISNYVAVFSDLTNRKEIEKRILFLSQFDALTALPNRAYFHEQLALCLRAENSRQHKVAVLTFDLDRFQLINESLGHAAGDRILIEAGNRLKGSITSGDKLCRLGGDEFAIILNHIDSNADAAALAVICQARLRKAIPVDGHEIHLSASIGISIFPDDADSVEGLIGCADSAMYAAIEQGGNTFRFFQQEMNTRSSERMRIESLLHHALERGELSVFFQPLVDARSGRIAGAEALLRWHNEELGAVSPGVFIPLLEDTQLIRQVGKWVLRKACLENKRWRQRTGRELFVAVNLSAVQLADDNLLKDIQQILDDTGCDPRYLEIELTESSIMHDSELGIRTLNRIKALGIRLSIDDFGTGYSSLSYLNQFPLDTLKIDRSFVMNATEDENAQAIIKAIVAMGHTLGFEIIAEGVETVDQLILLRNNAVDTLQGYHFSRPIPAIEFEELVTRVPAYPFPDSSAPGNASTLITLAERRR